MYKEIKRAIYPPVSCVSAIQSQDVEWYTALTSNLTEAQVKSLGEICVLADQRLAARESKKIEQQGGK